MEERAVGLDAGVEQRVDELVVEVDALLVRLAGAVGEDARPGDGEAEGLQTHALHHLDVLRVAVVEVVGDVAGVAVGGLAGGVGEGVPDGDAAAAFVDRAFHLIGRGGGAPEEAAGKFCGRAHRGLRSLGSMEHGGHKAGERACTQGEAGGLEEFATIHYKLLRQTIFFITKTIDFYAM